MQISQATEADLKQVVAISSDSVKSPHSMEYFRKRLGGFFYCLREVLHVCGFIIVSDGKLDLVAVEKSQRNKGYGKVLVDMIVDEFGELSLKVRESNKAARRLYEKTGWTEVGVAPRRYKDGERGILYHIEKRKR